MASSSIQWEPTPIGSNSGNSLLVEKFPETSTRSSGDIEATREDIALIEKKLVMAKNRFSGYEERPTRVNSRNKTTKKTNNYQNYLASQPIDLNQTSLVQTLGYNLEDDNEISKDSPMASYYEQFPLSMRKSGHKNKKPVHSSISQQTVNGLLSLLLLFLLSICGSIGSIFVISALTVIESLQTRGNSYLVSLSLAHLLVTILVIPSSALQIMSGDQGINSRALCHYQWLLLEFSLIISQMSFFFIALDNYLSYKSTEKLEVSIKNKNNSDNVISPLPVQSRNNNWLSDNSRGAIFDTDVREGSISAIVVTNNNNNNNNKRKLSINPSTREKRDCSIMIRESELALISKSIGLRRLLNCCKRNYFAQSTRIKLNEEQTKKNYEEKFGLAREFVGQFDCENFELIEASSNLIGYSNCCDKFKIIFWISFVWIVALIYTIHQHDLSYGDTFCKTYNNKYTTNSSMVRSPMRLPVPIVAPNSGLARNQRSLKEEANEANRRVIGLSLAHDQLKSIGSLENNDDSSEMKYDKSSKRKRKTLETQRNTFASLCDSLKQSTTIECNLLRGQLVSYSGAGNARMAKSDESVRLASASKGLNTASTSSDDIRLDDELHLWLRASETDRIRPTTEAKVGFSGPARQQKQHALPSSSASALFDANKAHFRPVNDESLDSGRREPSAEVAVDAGPVVATNNETTKTATRVIFDKGYHGSKTMEAKQATNGTEETMSGGAIIWGAHCDSCHRNKRQQRYSRLKSQRYGLRDMATNNRVKLNGGDEQQSTYLSENNSLTTGYKKQEACDKNNCHHERRKLTNHKRAIICDKCDNNNNDGKTKLPLRADYLPLLPQHQLGQVILELPPPKVSLMSSVHDTTRLIAGQQRLRRASSSIGFTELADGVDKSIISGTERATQIESNTTRALPSPKPIERPHFFWLMSLGMVICPSLISMILFACAFWRMKEFKLRFEKPLSLSSINCPLPASILIPSASPLPVIAKSNHPSQQISDFNYKSASKNQLAGNGSFFRAADTSKSSETLDLERVSKETPDQERSISQPTETETAINRVVLRNGFVKAKGGLNLVNPQMEPVNELDASKRSSTLVQHHHQQHYPDHHHHHHHYHHQRHHHRQDPNSSSHQQVNQVLSAPLSRYEEQQLIYRGHYEPKSSSVRLTTPYYIDQTDDNINRVRVSNPLPIHDNHYHPNRIFEQNWPNSSYSAPASATLIRNQYPLEDEPSGLFDSILNSNRQQCDSYRRPTNSHGLEICDAGLVTNSSHVKNNGINQPKQHHHYEFKRRQQHAQSFHYGCSSRIGGWHQQNNIAPIEQTLSRGGQIPLSQRETDISKLKQDDLASEATFASFIRQPEAGEHSLERHRSLPSSSRLYQSETGHLHLHSELAPGKTANQPRVADWQLAQLQPQHQLQQKLQPQPPLLLASPNAPAQISYVNYQQHHRNQQQPPPPAPLDTEDKPEVVQDPKPAHVVNAALANVIKLAVHESPVSVGSLKAGSCGGGCSDSSASNSDISKHSSGIFFYNSDVIAASSGHDPSNEKQDTKLSKTNRHHLYEPSKLLVCSYPFMTEDQLLKSNIIVFIMNLTLWIPFIILSIASHYRDSISEQFKDTVWWMATLNCCSCSYVYALTNKDFREAFNKLFYYCCCKSHVTFQKKTPIFRRQLDIDSDGNLRVHIIPGLNVYSNKQLFNNSQTTTTTTTATATNINDNHNHNQYHQQIVSKANHFGLDNQANGRQIVGRKYHQMDDDIIMDLGARKVISLSKPKREQSISRISLDFNLTGRIGESIDHIGLDEGRNNKHLGVSTDGPSNEAKATGPEPGTSPIVTKGRDRSSSRNLTKTR